STATGGSLKRATRSDSSKTRWCTTMRSVKVATCPRGNTITSHGTCCITTGTSCIALAGIRGTQSDWSVGRCSARRRDDSVAWRPSARASSTEHSDAWASGTRSSRFENATCAPPLLAGETPLPPETRSAAGDQAVLGPYIPPEGQLGGEQPEIEERIDVAHCGLPPPPALT